MNLGYKLKSVREQKRLSQQEVAEYIDVSQKTYSNYESCKTMPSIMHLIKLSEILNYNFIEYLREKERSNEPNIYDEFKVLSDKILNSLIINYEIIIKDKDEIINLLKEKIERIKIK